MTAIPTEPLIATRGKIPEGPRRDIRTVALIGPPNSGKSTLFNRLTRLRQKVGNYPGVTVEQRVGLLAGSGQEMCIRDRIEISRNPLCQDE